MENIYLNSIILLFLSLNLSVISQSVHYLQPGSLIEYKPFDNKAVLEIYCYNGRPKYIINIWQTIFLKIHSNSKNYEVYEGESYQQVMQKYEEHHSSWLWNMFATKTKSIKLDPFSTTCIGIESPDPYRVELHLIKIDFWKVLLLLFGILLFIYAPKLSENSLFYYLCGISFGILASFLIIVYYTSKLLPRKPLMYGFVVGGWTVGVYLGQLLWENIRVVLSVYQTYVIYYIIASGLISFAICYRWGPPTNPRSRNLIRWTLMCVGLFLIFNCSFFKEASMGIIIVLVILYNIPRVWIAKSRTFWKRRFPPKTRLLTNEEYYQQGVKETCKALEELREYCSSPKCNQWKTVLKLKDAKRFASFIEGDSHLSDDEILAYENDESVRMAAGLTDENLTDDSDASTIVL